MRICRILLWPFSFQYVGLKENLQETHESYYVWGPVIPVKSGKSAPKSLVIGHVESRWPANIRRRWTIWWIYATQEADWYMIDKRISPANCERSRKLWIMKWWIIWLGTPWGYLLRYKRGLSSENMRLRLKIGNANTLAPLSWSADRSISPSPEWSQEIHARLWSRLLTAPD